MLFINILFTLFLTNYCTVQGTANVQRRSTASLPTIDSAQFDLIWIDACIFEVSDDCRHTQSLFRELIPAAKFELDVYDAVFTISRTKYTEKKLLLVVSGKKASFLLSSLEEYDLNDHIEAIFIFCNKPEDYQHLQHDKLFGVFTDAKLLIDTVRASIFVHSSKKVQTPPNPFDGVQTWFRSASMTTLPRIWHKLLLENLVSLPRDEQSKQDMIKKSKEYFAKDIKELRRIEEFSADYSSELAIQCSELAIQWYTADSFVHKLVNHALRSENVDLLYAYRFFISDLSAEIKRWQTVQQTDSGTVISKIKNGLGSRIKLFSGQRLRKGELEKLKQSIGTIISINGFLSTSMDLSEAKEFTKRAMQFPDMQQVIIEISFDTSLQEMNVFAEIAYQSKYNEEEEVLFDYNSLFNVTDVKCDLYSSIWTVKMTSLSKNAIKEHPYLNTIRENFVENHSGTVAFGIIMAHGFDKAEQVIRYFDQMLLNLPHHHVDVPDILQQRAILYQEKGEHALALQDYERALEIRRQRIQENLLGISSLSGDIGRLHSTKSDFQASMKSHQLAMSTYEQLYGTEKDHITKAKVNESIGLTYYQSGNASKALEYLAHTQVAYKQLLPEKHLLQIELLGHIGAIHEEMGNLSLAEKFFRRQLNWSETVLPVDHPLIITFLESIYRIHLKMNQTLNISEIFTGHLGKLQKILEPQDALISRVLFMAASLFESSTPAEAIIVYEQTIDLSQISTQLGRSTMLKCHKKLVEMYKKSGDLAAALEHANKALDLQRQFSFEERNITAEADALYTVGLIHIEMNTPAEALPYLMKALIIYQSTHMLDHPSIQVVLNSIAEAVNRTLSLNSE
ncbi:unnamed protein product [Rotaria socialis]|uniref:Uncharacterized protein n=1 Tax=Rotaria socialis TaxID=392032 RepID=A0A820PWU4_9BILA|nr:unnamed protein product [Rotaria socialis]